MIALVSGFIVAMLALRTGDDLDLPFKDIPVLPHRFVVYPHSNNNPVLVPTTTALTLAHHHALPFESAKVIQRKDHLCTEPELFWDSPIAGGGMNGFAAEAVAVLVGLEARGVDVSLHTTYFDEEFVFGLDDHERNVVEQLFEAGQQLATADHPPDLFISQWSPPELLDHVFSLLPDPVVYAGKGSPRLVSRTMYEADGLPRGWLDAINKIDEVWVPSEWNKAVWVKDGVPASKIFVVGEGVDTAQRFNPASISKLEARERVVPRVVRDNYLFLSVFKFEKRKGWEELVTAFVEEFGCEEPVTLLLRTGPDPPDRIRRFIKEDTRGYCHVPLSYGLHRPGREIRRSVTVLPRIPELDYAAMFKAADSFVSASHGEGWGRPIVEAMAMGLPVIATNWSAMLEYMTEENSFPVPVTDFEECPDEPQLEWASINIPALRKLLRLVYTERDLAESRGKKARELVQKRYTPDLVLDKMMELAQNACEARRQEQRKHRKAESRRIGVRGRESELVW